MLSAAADISDLAVVKHFGTNFVRFKLVDVVSIAKNVVLTKAPTEQLVGLFVQSIAVLRSRKYLCVHTCWNCINLIWSFEKVDVIQILFLLLLLLSDLALCLFYIVDLRQLLRF